MLGLAVFWEDYFELCSVVYPQSPSVHPPLPQEGHQPHPHCGLYQGSHPRPLVSIPNSGGKLMNLKGVVAVAVRDGREAAVAV